MFGKIEKGKVVEISLIQKNEFIIIPDLVDIGWTEINNVFYPPKNQKNYIEKAKDDNKKIDKESNKIDDLKKRIEVIEIILGLKE